MMALILLDGKNKRMVCLFKKQLKITILKFMNNIVLYILVRSSLFILIEPSSVNETCLAAAVGSLRFRIIVKASLIAKVAITTRTKLIPSVKFILLNVNLVISDKESCPTDANIKPRTTIIIAFKNCPFDEKAAIAVNPKIIKAK